MAKTQQVGNWIHPGDLKSLLMSLVSAGVHHTIMIRGEHGIGKSEIVHAVAEHICLPLVDQRVALMSPGDMIGVPNHALIQEQNVTNFAPPGWLAKACSEPVVLFLDEANRGDIGVQNAAMQLFLDRRLGDNILHPGTFVFAAVNTGWKYSVQSMDPAQLSRMAVYDLLADADQWLLWAAATNADGVENIHPVIRMFIEINRQFLFTTKDVEEGAISPTPRSWKRLNDAMLKCGLDPNMLKDGTLPGIAHHLFTSYVGIEAAAVLENFLREYSKNVTPEDVLDWNRWQLVRKKVAGMYAEQKLNLAKQLFEHIKQKNLCLAEWDPEAVFPEDGSKGLWVFPKGGKSGGLLEFLMTMLNDEQFMYFYMGVIDNIVIEDPVKIQTEEGHIYGWVRTYISLQNYGEWQVPGEPEPRSLGMRFVEIQRRSLPKDGE